MEERTVFTALKQISSTILRINCIWLSKISQKFIIFLFFLIYFDKTKFDDNSDKYGEVQSFVSIGGYHCAILKCYTVIHTTICNIDIDPPDDQIVKLLTNNRLVGNHHVAINGPPEPDLKAVFCEKIIGKCIFVCTQDPTVYGYLTPILDYNCK